MDALINSSAPKPTSNPLLRALRQKAWSPYVAGTGIGLLSCVVFYTMDTALGTSSSFVHMAGMVGGLFTPGHIAGPEANAYYAKQITESSPLFDWQVFLVIGVFLGAMVSSWSSGDRLRECVPSLWAWRFGPSKALRYGAAFVSGILLLFGARMAGGCTSGHGISGTLQLAVSSWVFFIAFFGSGIASAFILFGREGRHHVRD